MGFDRAPIPVRTKADRDRVESELAALRVEAAHLTPEQIDFLAAGLIAALAARLAEYSTTEGDGRGELP